MTSIATLSISDVVNVVGNKRVRNDESSSEILNANDLSNLNDEFESDDDKKNKLFLNLLMTEDLKRSLDEFQVNQTIDTMNTAVEAFRCSLMSQINGPFTKCIMIELFMGNAEVAFLMLRSSCMRDFFKQLLWKVPYFLCSDALNQLDAQFFPEDPHKFLREWIEVRTFSRLQFKEFKLVTKFTSHLSVFEYKQMKEEILDYIEAGPVDMEKPNKTVILDRRKFKLNLEQFRVIEYLAMLHPTRLKAEEELVASGLI